MSDKIQKFRDIWTLCGRGAMYIKIDDDIIFIDDSTIKQMVDAKTAHPELLLISANIINNPAMSWVHYHLPGATRSYLPEVIQRENATEVSWHASKLPRW